MLEFFYRFNSWLIVLNLSG